MSLHCYDLYGASQKLRSYQLAGQDDHERESRLDRLTVAVVHGTVINTAGSPLAGVEVAVEGRPELGFVTTGDAGRYAITLDGGQAHYLSFSRESFLLVQRLVSPERRQQIVQRSVILTVASAVAAVPIPLPAQGNILLPIPLGANSDGRRVFAFIPEGLSANVSADSGSETELTSLTLRLTDFGGSQSSDLRRSDSLPLQMPPNVGPTYAYSLESLEAADMLGAQTPAYLPRVDRRELNIG